MRKPKPYYRKQTGTWYLQLGKRQIRLSKNEEEAFQKYHEIMLNQSAYTCLLYTSPSPRDGLLSRMPSSA